MLILLLLQLLMLLLLYISLSYFNHSSLCILLLILPINSAGTCDDARVKNNGGWQWSEKKMALIRAIFEPNFA